MPRKLREREYTSCARTLTDAGIDPKHADAITAAVRQAADQGEHVTRAELRAELVSLELRLVKWIVGAALACASLVIAVLRLFGG